MKPSDNTALAEKVALRRALLAQLDAPTVLETHAGAGLIYNQCYRALSGVACEQDDQHYPLLDRRPNWTIIHTDCLAYLAEPRAELAAVSLLDCDPWGCPLPMIAHFLAIQPHAVARIAIAATDGTGFHEKSYGRYYPAYGKALRPNRSGTVDLKLSPAQLRQAVTALAEQAGFRLASFYFLYAGAHRQLFLWAALLDAT